jgi:hypothetical protein
MDLGELRAGDADRERVAERLRIALEEGRLNLYEYDDRLRDAFSAKTYTDLDKLLADLPNVTPPSQQQLVPAGEAPVPDRWQLGPDGRYQGVTRMWLAELWGSWFRANAICWTIWAVTGFFASWSYSNIPWPVWVSVPWGVVLLFHTIGGLSGGEPQRWAAKQHRKQAERRSRKDAERGARDDAERGARENDGSD